MTTVTCHTSGCPSSGQPVDVDLSYTDPDTGEVFTSDPYCGACGQPITDIDNGEPPEPEAPPVVDNTLPPVVDNTLPPEQPEQPEPKG